VNLIDVETQQRKQTVAGHSDQITSISVSSSAKAFITGSFDGTVRLWDLSSGKCNQTITQKAPVWSVAFAPRGEQFVIACQDGTVSLIALQK
jgi:WD40 repeat protein